MWQLQLKRLGVPLAVWCIAFFLGQTHAGEIPQFAGYTRPGQTPSMIKPAADGLPAGIPFGGTVYFMVYDLGGDLAKGDSVKGDPWGTGIKDFNQAFRTGIDFGGGPSPNLDTKARYLYLYQIVNDRGTTTPIETASMKLLVELKDITSWGYFHGLGFGSPQRDDKENEESAIKPVSAVHGLDFSEEAKVYRSPSRPVQNSGLKLIQVRTTRDDIAQPDDKGKIVNVIWDALDPATDPDYVMLLSNSDFDKSPSFRAIWSGKNVLGKDGRSTVFGFTSNLPPTFEPVRIRTTREAAKDAGNGIRLVGTEEQDEPGLADGPLGVQGAVPTPRPENPVTANLPTDPGPPAAGGFPGLGSMGTPQQAGGGGGGFSGGGVSAGGFGNARPPTMGGGAGAGGGGNNGNRNQQNQAQTPNITIKYNATLINQLEQFVKQYQEQQQKQNQGQNGGNGQGHCCNGHGNIVPEPTTWLTAMLGLPALAWVRRRRTAVS